MEAGGIEPKASENQGLTTIGQNRSSKGHPASETGQQAGVATASPSADGSNSGQNGATSGDKWNVPPASADGADLARVVAAWSRLRPELKAAMLAMVEASNRSGIPKERSREGSGLRTAEPS